MCAAAARSSPRSPSGARASRSSSPTRARRRSRSSSRCRCTSAPGAARSSCIRTRRSRASPRAPSRYSMTQPAFRIVDKRLAADLAALVPDGALLALPPDYSLPSMAVVRQLIIQKKKNLRLLGVPVLGMCADLLIGAGCVAEVESSAVSLGEAGPAPRFTEAVEKGEIKVRDATCPAVHTALQASEKGVPFMPLRGVLGSDLMRIRTDWRESENPFSPGKDPILLVPAISPDIALFHARWADDAGNVWVGRRRELATIAHAAK